MSYNKKVWKSGDRITKEALNNMENGIEAAHQNSGGTGSVAIVDNLNSNSSTSALSAKQGKELNNKMPAKSIVEGGKIYLAKEDGTKLDSGTELPAGGTGTSYDDTEIKSDINTIKTDLGSEELTTTAKDIKGAVNEVAAQYKDIANLKNSTNVVNLEKYNITQADYEYPFTTENYKVAYQNGVGFQQAIDDAKEKNIQELIIPPGNYPLCYSGDTKECSNTIINIEGVNLRGYGVKLYIIYDELDTGLNPYFTGEVSLTHTMMGKIFKTDSDIEGFELVGERAYRTTENAKYREGSYGIVLNKNTNGNSIKNCKIYQFSGDGIGGGSMQQLANWLEGADALATAITWNGTAWTPSTISYTTPRHSIGWADITKSMQIRSNSYRIWSVEPLKIHCFKGILGDDGNYTEGEYIGTIKVRQGEPFYFLEGTYYWYLEIVDSAEHTTDKTSQIGVAIGYGILRNTTVENCDISLNTRGGISNLPSGSIVKNCTIHHNGCKYGNMVAFYDGTQFGIDIEDWYIHEITIDNCLFYGQLHDILYRCDKINILNTITFGIVKSLTDTIDFYACNSKFNGNVDLNGGISFGKRVAIGCNFKNGIPNNLEIIKSVGIASNDSLGLVKPISKSDNMTQLVGVDVDGRLYTLPSSSSDGSTISGAKWDILIDKTVTLSNVNRITEDFKLQGNYNCFKLYLNRSKNTENTVTSLRMNNIVINGISCGAFSFDIGNPQTDLKDIYIKMQKVNKIMEWEYCTSNGITTNQVTMQKGIQLFNKDITFTNKLQLGFNNSYTGDVRIILEGTTC